MTVVASRRALFFLLAALFFITAPITILYAFGFRYNQKNGIFIYSGAVSLKTNLSAPVISIDGEFVPQRRISFINNFTQINGIRPGEHQIEVSAPGYQTWKKRFVVQSGISTEFWNVFLPQTNYQRDLYPASGVKKFFTSPKNDLIALIREENETLNVDILDIDEQESETVFSSADFMFTDDQLENIEWTPQAHRISVPLKTKDGQKRTYAIIDLEENSILYLNELIDQDDLERVRWDPHEKNALFYLAADNLYRLNIEQPGNPVLVAENITGYDLSPDYLYYFQLPSGVVYRANLEDGSNRTQVTLAPPSEMTDPNYRIVAYDNRRIWMLNQSGTFFVFNQGARDNYFRRLADGVIGAQFSNDGKKLLYWTEREIYVYFVRDWETQPIRNENEIQNITRFSQPIRNVQWFQDYEHVIFSAGSTIKMAELDQRDYAFIRDITAASKAEPSVFNNYGRNQLYFTDTDPLEPEKATLYSIDFLEEAPIFSSE